MPGKSSGAQKARESFRESKYLCGGLHPNEWFKRLSLLPRKSNAPTGNSTVLAACSEDELVLKPDRDFAGDSPEVGVWPLVETGAFNIGAGNV
jgi:hypothetical protein